MPDRRRDLFLRLVLDLDGLWTFRWLLSLSLLLPGSITGTGAVR